MDLHPHAFDSIKPTEAQLLAMQKVRDGAKEFYELLDRVVPDGPDKTFVVRQLMGLVMWANRAVMHRPDGAPRGDS
jgi:hypothetical protein